MDDLKDAIKQLLKESEKYSDNAAAGYDEGWYNGEKNAYNNVLDIIKKTRKVFPDVSYFLIIPNTKLKLNKVRRVV